MKITSACAPYYILKTMNVEHIFAANADYLSDVYGVDYTNGNPYMGWYDPSALFCDNVVFWCLIHWIKGTRPKAEISTYVSLIRCMFGEVLEVVQFKVSYVTSGLCKEGDTTFPSSMQTKKAKELDRKEIAPGHISVKVSFENVPFVNLLPVLKSVTNVVFQLLFIIYNSI